MESGISIYVKKISKNWGKILIVILIMVMAVFQIETNRLNERFLGDMQYYESRGFAREENSEYSVKVYTMQGWDYVDELRASITVDNIDYKDEFPITITLTVYAGRWGKCRYLVEYDEYFLYIDEDTVKREFGDWIWVDKDMNYLPENEYDIERNEFTKQFLKDNKETLQRITEIANESWGLELSCEGIEDK